MLERFTEIPTLSSKLSFCLKPHLISSATKISHLHKEHCKSPLRTVLALKVGLVAEMKREINYLVSESSLT
jgi:hypothetical protein